MTAPSQQAKGGRPSRKLLQARLNASPDSLYKRCEDCNLLIENGLPRQSLCTECRTAYWEAWLASRRQKRSRGKKKAASSTQEITIKPQNLDNEQ